MDPKEIQKKINELTVQLDQNYILLQDANKNTKKAKEAYQKDKSEAVKKSVREWEEYTEAIQTNRLAISESIGALNYIKMNNNNSAQAESSQGPSYRP